MANTNSLSVEEHTHGDTVWIAVRARGADWSWLTPDEAAHLGRHWVEKYGVSSGVHRPANE
jgi:hypothetical protein